MVYTKKIYVYKYIASYDIKTSNKYMANIKEQSFLSSYLSVRIKKLPSTYPVHFKLDVSV